VLGPWAAVIAISVTLVLQALMFGDGGITAIAANCFNMAVVIPFAAFYIYSALSGRSEITSSRRIIAAAVAGYISLTLAAACAGFMLGIQPLLHTDVNGVPLYMPYGLNVTMPAMVLEHALGFSFLEALVTALILAYLQKADPSLLEMGTSGAQKRKKIASAII
jgi:cobalt/nickel transport system permease protein